MDFYEEFGVPRTASDEEIRRAYRNLARLLHPDQQSDDILRRLAGIQMARLNQVLETLLEPRQRARYDASLGIRSTRIAAPRAGRGHPYFQNGREWEESGSGPIPKKRMLTWVGAGVIGIAAIALFFSQSGAVESVSAGAEANTLTLPQPTMDAGAVPSVSFVPRNASSHGNSFSAEGPSGSTTAKFDGNLGLTPRRSDGLVGEWFYAQHSRPVEMNGMCPPAYIDLQVLDEGGQLKGRYSAKYMVGGRSISPFVFFEFEGASNTPRVDLPWKGPGGAAGHVRLTLVSARSLQVEWTANHLGDEFGLASGKATLTRRELP